MLPTEVLVDVIRMTPYKSLHAFRTVSSKLDKIICVCFSEEDRVFATLYSQINDGAPSNSVIALLCTHPAWEAIQMSVLDRLVEAMSFKHLVHALCQRSTPKHAKKKIGDKILQVLDKKFG